MYKGDNYESKYDRKTDTTTHLDDDENGISIARFSDFASKW